MKLFHHLFFNFSAAVRVFAGACVLLAIAVSGWSCKDDDNSENVYMALTSGSFFFDPGMTLVNTVNVEANTTWQVGWTPEIEGVVITPANGTGNGTIQVTDMPVGATIQVALYHMLSDGTLLRSNPITVARGAME